MQYRDSDAAEKPRHPPASVLAAQLRPASGLAGQTGVGKTPQKRSPAMNLKPRRIRQHSSLVTVFYRLADALAIGAACVGLRRRLPSMAPKCRRRRPRACGCDRLFRVGRSPRHLSQLAGNLAQPRARLGRRHLGLHVAGVLAGHWISDRLGKCRSSLERSAVLIEWFLLSSAADGGVGWPPGGFSDCSAGRLRIRGFAMLGSQRTRISIGRRISPILAGPRPEAGRLLRRSAAHACPTFRPKSANRSAISNS